MHDFRRFVLYFKHVMKTSSRSFLFSCFFRLGDSLLLSIKRTFPRFGGGLFLMDSRHVTVKLTLAQVLLIARALKSQGENELAERFESLYQRTQTRYEDDEAWLKKVREIFEHWSP
nr:MAG TPA: hypothetical protein [Caudoviricetes sp.]